MITIEFPRNTPTYIGYIEMALGVGLMFGPILGSVFMQVLNSIMYTFFAFGALLTLGLFIVLGGLPQNLNNPAIDEKFEIDGREKEPQKVSFVMFLKY